MTNALALFFEVFNLAAWVLCFTWMHRISKRQDAVLSAMAEQGRRIERLSVSEHKLIKEVHPVVGAIKERVEEMADAVQVTAQTVKGS